MTEEKKTRGRPKASAKAEETPSKETQTKKVSEETPKREITKDTMVTVYNNTSGELLYSARKGNGFLHLMHFMDSDEMTVEELQQMRNTSRVVLEDGWLYIDDEEVLEYLRLGKLKNKVMSPQSLEDLVETGTPNKIKEVVAQLSSNSKVTVYSLVRDKFKGGELGNVYTIKAVEEALGVSPEDSLLRE